MTSEENRRTFLSALLLAGGSAAAFTESYRVAAAGKAGDPLFDYIQDQLAGMLRATRARGGVLQAEDAAAAATCMRICGAHARGLRLDDAAREALASQLRSTSRDVVIATTPEWTSLRARLRRKGLAISDRIIDEVARADRPTRSAVLEAIAGGRSTVICDRLAEALEAAAPRLAEKHRVVKPVVAVDAWWCNFYLNQWSMYLALAWTLAQFEDPELQDFVDAAWAGFVFYDDLYVTHCEREVERQQV
jgi:hypothetical protein